MPCRNETIGSWSLGRAYDDRFEVHERRGKGSHRDLSPRNRWRQTTLPLPYHGQKTIIHIGLQKELIRIFQLPADIFD